VLWYRGRNPLGGKSCNSWVLSDRHGSTPDVKPPHPEGMGFLGSRRFSLLQHPGLAGSFDRIFGFSSDAL
jgi:hypothetical protein